MANAVIANASIAVTPTFPGLSAAINKAFGANGVTRATTATGAKAGSDFSSSFGGSIMKSGAIAGAVSAVAGKAISTVTASMGSAIARFDTLNNYPKVMQALGYEADVVSASLSTMDERLQGLPTSLDSMVSLVQGLVTTTGDLTLATDAGLALNDMLIASGSSAELTSAAMEQFRQILAKGKPEMQDWRSLTSAMPGQMDQLAKAMLGADANANDLYKALGGGGEEATITTTDLLNAMIRLDKEGGEGIAAFAEQAKTASGGVATSMANLQTAVTRGLAGTLDAIGKDTVADAFASAKDAINETFATVNGAVKAVMPVIKGTVIPAFQGLASAAKALAPAVLPAVAAFAAMSKGSAALSKALGAGGIAMKLATVQRAFSLAASGSMTFKRALSLLGVSFNPVALGVAAAAAAIGLAVTAFSDWKAKTEAATKATQGLRDAVSSTAALDSYAGKVDGIGSSAGATRVSIDELNKSIGNHVDKMAETTKAAQSQIAELNTAEQIIGDYAGVTDLTTQQQGRLEWALSLVNEQFGLSISAVDVMAGKYEDANGEVVSLKDSIFDLIEAKKQEIKMQALTDNLSDAYAAQNEAASAYGAAYDHAYNDEDGGYKTVKRNLERERKLGINDYSDEYIDSVARSSAEAGLKGYKDALDGASDAVRGYEAALGDSMTAASEAASEYDKWGNKFKETFKGVNAVLERKLGANGLGMLKDDLASLGANTEQLGNLTEGQMQKIVDAYDGTGASIVDVLDGMGVSMDEAAKKNAKAAKDIAKAFSDMGLELDGVDMGAFSQKLADAGVSTEELNDIGSENLSALAQACGDNVDAMVWYLKHYNDTPLLDKDGKVQVDEAELIDAQGNVYTWNGSELYDKDNQVVTDDVSLTDAQGNLWTWNGSTLEDKSGSAHIEDGQLVDANGAIRAWDDRGSDLGTKTGVVNIIKNIIDGAVSLFSGNAAGGIRLNAAGGYRFHAGGAIARRAVPLDIVGEDGAEAIVPLTNRRYSQPFADLIAEQVNKGRDEASSENGVISWLASNLPAIIAECTPTVGERDFARMARKAVANG